MFCAECKRKNVYIDNTGQPAEFCSNLCRKAAVESRHVQPCIKCRIWPMVRLPDGTRSPFCGKACQNSGMGSIGPPVRPPIPLQQPPYRPMMPPPQFNQPNPPIGMSSHPTQLIPGGGRPGGPWVMTTVPFCRNCQQKPCWKDNMTQTYSSYCSRRCKEIAERAPRAVSSMNNANNASYTSQQNYNMSPNSPISPVLQTNGILSSLQGGQSGNILPSSQGGNTLSSSQGGNISPQGGNMSRYSLYQQQQSSYQTNNMQNVQQQQHFQNQQLQSSQNNIQQPQFPQNPSNNIQHPRPLPNENIPQSRKSDSSLYQTNNNSQRQHDNDFDDSNDLQQSQASDSSQNNHHLRYLDTVTPISHPRTDSQSPNSQSPPPIPDNKPTLVNPQAPINITINTSLPISSQQSTETHPRSPPSPPPRKTETRPRSPPSPPPRKTKKDLDYQFQFQGQVREQNQLYHPPVQQSPPTQVQEQNRPLSPQSQSQPRSPQSPNRPQSQNQIQSQSRPQSQNQIQSQSRPQSQNQIQSQSRPQSQNQIQSQSRPQSQNQIQSQSQPQSQPRLRDQPQSQSQPQVPNHSHPQPQSDGLHPDDNFMITPYTYNPEAPPPYTPNDAYVPLGDRKVTRDDSFDEDNPYGFRDDNSNVQDQNNDQPNYNQEQRTQRNILRRR